MNNLNYTLLKISAMSRSSCLCLINTHCVHQFVFIGSWHFVNTQTGMLSGRHTQSQLSDLTWRRQITSRNPERSVWGLILTCCFECAGCSQCSSRSCKVMACDISRRSLWLFYMSGVSAQTQTILFVLIVCCFRSIWLIWTANLYLQCCQTFNLLTCHTRQVKRKAIKLNPGAYLWVKGFSNALYSDERDREQLNSDSRPSTPSKCAIDQYVVIKPLLNECLSHSKDYQLSSLSLFLPLVLYL